MYNILWFDDDFTTEKSDDRIIEARRISFKNDVERSKEYGIQYDTACTYEEFAEKIQKNEGQYQAVILDLMGLNPNNSSDDTGIYKAEEILLKTQGILKYVLSNNTNNPKFKDFIYVKFGKENIFSKATDWDLMFSKIKNDLDGNLYYYLGHEECLWLFNEGFLDSKDNRGRMDKIMKSWVNNESQTILYNDIRQILENMLIKIAMLPQNKDMISYTNQNDVDSFNSKMYYITDKYNEINGKKNYNDPKMPYSKCSHEIKRVLKYLGDLTNRYSHYQNNHPDYLLPGNLQSEYDPYFMTSIYNAFYIAMKWFYGYMVKESQLVPNHWNH